jgi:alpha-1,3-rhamnosyl/mannosyltransferase
MKVGIDARAIHFPGIGRYIRELVRHLAKVDTKNHYIVYYSAPSHLSENTLENPHFQSVVITPNIYTVKEQIYWPYRLSQDKVDLFHATTSLAIPLLCPCRLVVTLHDLLLKVFPQFLPSTMASIYFTIMNWWTIRSAAHIIAVSHFTANELISLYPASRAKVTTIYNGISPTFHLVDDSQILTDVQQKYGIKKPYLLYVGTYKKHKNLVALVKAYAQLPTSIRDTYQLVIVGKHDPRYPEVPALCRQLRLEEAIISLDYVREEDLPALYSGATVFVFPSLYEGFGFPLLEAMACGVPVITSQTSSLSEIAGNAALLVDPQNISAITEAISRVVSEAKLSAHFQEQGLQRAKDFSWFTTAKQVLAVYESVMASSNAYKLSGTAERDT